MSAFSELVTENPMLVEIKRVRSRMFSTRSGGSNIAVIVLILIFYIIILVSVLLASQVLDPVIIIIFQTGIVALLLPVSVSSSIAGERENRTWDILISTPVTKAQIVAGKFIASLAVLGIFYSFFLIPVLACLVRNPSAHFSSVLMAELVSVTFSVLLIAYSLLISARSRTTFAAIGTCVGVEFVLLGAVPGFISSALGDTGNDFLGMTHPFGVMGWLADRREGPGFHLWAPPLLNSAIYIVVAMALLLWATTTVRKMEEIKNVMPEPEGKRRKANA